MTVERAHAFKFGSMETTLLGPELKVGDKAPNFEVVANNLSRVTLADSQGKVRIISVVPSLETGTCDTQTRRFNEEAAALGDHIAVLTISADLPFCQAKWCGSAGVERVQTLSDHVSMSFGNAYGTHIKEVRLDSRAAFVVDSSDTLVYVEYLATAPEQPNYAAVIEAAKNAK
jgi:thioredoxin-dependent peroxiredoxin